MNVKVTEHRKLTGLFRIDNNWYYASLVYLSAEDGYDCNECMIFQANSRGKVTNWSELYCRRHIDMSVESLIKCIKEFCKDDLNVQCEVDYWVEQQGGKLNDESGN